MEVPIKRLDSALVANNHMKQRCYFIWIMCGLSLYSTNRYSIFNHPPNAIMTPYYHNCLLFIVYLLWDFYAMIGSSKRKILFRTDLCIHHTVSLLSVLSVMQFSSLIYSNFLLMECISALNYVLRKKEHCLMLNYYRLGCIFFVRMPTWIYYFSILDSLFQHTEYAKYAYYLKYFLLFFICYDMILVRKICTFLREYEPPKIKN